MKKDILVLEAKTVASGQTGRTTAEMYARANEEAIKEYERLIKNNKIDCDFEKTTAYLYSTNDKKQLMNEVKAATSLGIDAIL